MVTITKWSANDIARMIGCPPNKATDRIRGITRTARRVLFADPEALAPSGRPDRAVTAAIAFIRTAGKIAEADPEGLKVLFRTIADSKTATTGPSPRITRIARKGKR